MKITVDGNVVTIDYDNNPHECKCNCNNNIVEECIEQQKNPATYRDEFLKFCEKQWAEQIKNVRESSNYDKNFIVSWAKETPYFVGIEINWALNQFAVKYNKILNWDNPDTITEWLDSEVKEPDDN